MADRHIGRSPAAQFRVGFWDSPLRQTASTEDVVLLMYCLLSPYRRPAGLYQWNERLAAAQIGWDPPQLRQVADRLEAKGAAYFVDGWVWIPSWFDHNSTPGPGVYQGFAESLATAPQVLYDRWHQDALDRGLPVDTWMSGGRGGGTPPSTLPTTMGRSGVKQQRGNDLKKAELKEAAAVPDGIVAAAALDHEVKRKHPIRTSSGIECWYASEDAMAAMLENTIPREELLHAVANLRKEKNRSGNVQSAVPALVLQRVDSLRGRAAQSSARQPAAVAAAIAPEILDKGIEICAGYLKKTRYQKKVREA